MDTVANLKFSSKGQERLFLQKSREHLRQLYAQGPEAVAEALNRRCPWCQSLLVPQILDGWKGLQAVFPDYCGCKGERAGLAAEEKRRQEALDEADRRRWTLGLSRAGLVGWLANATFESYTDREDWDGAALCRAGVWDYANVVLGGGLGDQPWLVLHGYYGTGKTHLAAAVVREALTHGWSQCSLRVWPDYIKRLQASFNHQKGEERTSDIVDELERGRLDVIDEIDKKEPSRSGFTENELFTVLNYRYNERLPTVLTFNHGPRDTDRRAPGRMALERYLGRAILDRVVGAAYDVIGFDGPSHRWSQVE